MGAARGRGLVVGGARAGCMVAAGQGWRKGVWVGGTAGRLKAARMSARTAAQARGPTQQEHVTAGQILYLSFGNVHE